MIIKSVLKYALILLVTAMVVVYPEKAAELFVLTVNSVWELAVNIARSIRFPGKKEVASAIILVPGIFQFRFSKISEQRSIK